MQVAARIWETRSKLVSFAVHQLSDAVGENDGLRGRKHDGGQGAGRKRQREKATCNLTADCASFTSSSDIARSQYRGSGQEQESSVVLLVFVLVRCHQEPREYEQIQKRKETCARESIIEVALRGYRYYGCRWTLAREITWNWFNSDLRCNPLVYCRNI